MRYDAITRPTLAALDFACLYLRATSACLLAILSLRFFRHLHQRTVIIITLFRGFRFSKESSAYSHTRRRLVSRKGLSSDARLCCPEKGGPGEEQQYTRAAVHGIAEYIKSRAVLPAIPPLSREREYIA